jgi:IS4 transposase
MVLNLRRLVKKFIGHLPQNDYPALNTFLFVSCWLNFALDSGVSSMRDMFHQLNLQGIKVDISTFSKASKKRDIEVFEKVLNSLIKELKSKQVQKDDLAIFPLDSTTITLTSKLLWNENIHQVKLFSGLNLLTSEPGGILIHFGFGHDNKYGDETIKNTPENGVAVMDRGFASLGRIAQLLLDEKRFFVLRIPNNYSLKMLDNEKFIIGTKKDAVEARVVAFCDLENKTEYRLVTNLHAEKNEVMSAVSNEEIGEIYRQRWQIELLWKFLKMHLKLDRIITKNTNGITIQIYSSLIAYLFLQLLEIPQEYGKKALDKLRYLLAFMKEKRSFIHWFAQLAFLS